MTAPSWYPRSRVLDDLALMWLEVLPPFLGGSSAVPMDAATAHEATAAGALILINADGTPLARMSELRIAAGPALEGRVELLNREALPFESLMTPLSAIPDGPRFWLDHPLTTDDLTRIEQERDTPVLLIGCGREAPRRAISPSALVRSCISALPHAAVVPVPLSPRETEFDATIEGAYAPLGAVRLPGTGRTDARVEEAILHELRASEDRGLVVFFTGLSGSGKSTLAASLGHWILEHTDRSVTSLDGDVARRQLSKGLGFSREDRATNVLRIGWVAAEIARHGGIALCSPIAPEESIRDQVRDMTSAVGGRFVLIHVATPIEECERRDVKGLYARARAGQIPDFTGVSAPYDIPECPDLRLDTTGMSPGEALEQLLELLPEIHNRVSPTKQPAGAFR